MGVGAEIEDERGQPSEQVTLSNKNDRVPAPFSEERNSGVCGVNASILCQGEASSHWRNSSMAFAYGLAVQWHPTPVLLPGKSHGQRSLVGAWDCEESDRTERLHFHFSLSCIGEGNGNPLQCSCLENPRDGVAWWAAVYGVAQSQTQLKRLSSSSSSRKYWMRK